MKIAAAVAVIILGILVIIFLYPSLQKGSSDPASHTFSTGYNSPSNSSITGNVKNNVTWSFDFDRKRWVVSGTPPACPEPFVVDVPVDLALVSGILYPGQIRGMDYKPHGGFRFDNLANNKVDVYAPIDARLYQGARHLENGEVQYSLYFINDCGFLYKLDHLKVLTPAFEEIFNTIPMGAEGDSRTTQIQPPFFTAKGEHIATEVGFEKSRNVFIDFGLYDLRRTNGVVYNSEFRSRFYNIDELGTHAVCWFDKLRPEDEALVRSLPAGGNEGKSSDYCL